MLTHSLPSILRAAIPAGARPAAKDSIRAPLRKLRWILALSAIALEIIHRRHDLPHLMGGR